MNINNAKIMRDAERFLKRTQEYQEVREMGDDENYDIHYILKKDSKGVLTDVFALAAYDDMGITFHPYAKPPIVRDSSLGFNYEDGLFKLLEEGYEIVSMSMDSHYCIWTALEESQDEEMMYPSGVQTYLAYCKRNGVTHEKLQETVHYDSFDAMTLM